MELNNDELIDKIRPDPDKYYTCIKYFSSKGFTLLMRLITKINKYPQLKKYLENYIQKNPASINEKNSAGWTAIMLAVGQNDQHNSLGETVKLLIKNGAAVNEKNLSGWNALMIAVMYNNNGNNIKLLLEYKSHTNFRDVHGKTALMLAIMCNDTESVLVTLKLLLKYGADTNLQSNDGTTSLMAAIIYTTKYTFEIAQLLLKYKADPNLFDDDGLPAIMWAARMDPSAKIIKLLLEWGADTKTLYSHNLDDEGIMISLNKALTMMNKEQMDKIECYKKMIKNDPNGEYIESLKEDCLKKDKVE